MYKKYTTESHINIIILLSDLQKALRVNKMKQNRHTLQPVKTEYLLKADSERKVSGEEGWLELRIRRQK